VSYWEKFGAIAFDGSQKAILTSCTLKSPGPEAEPGGGASRDGGKSTRTGSGSGGGSGVVRVELGPAKAGAEKDKDKDGEGAEERVRCCFSFTIRRDMHNM